MDAKRGFVPEDVKNFSPQALEIMRTAARHVCYLINEDYDLKQATTFVGNHYLLSERQRLAIMRSVATQAQIENRQKKQVAMTAQTMSGREVWIDGFNTIITLEVLLSDSVLFSCMDGTIRDLAALRGTYRLITETEDAIRILFELLQEVGVSRVNILLDQPVSNSGRLKTCLAEIGEKYPYALDIQILREVDRELYDKEFVITSDSIILDHCISWVNLTAECLKRKQKEAFQVYV